MPSKYSKTSRSSKKSSKKISKRHRVKSHSDYGKRFKNERGLCLYSSLNVSNPIPRFMDVSIRGCNTSVWLTPVGTGLIIQRVRATCYQPFLNLTGANGITGFPGSSATTNCRGFLNFMQTAGTAEGTSGGLYIKYTPLSSKVTVRATTAASTTLMLAVCPSKSSDAVNPDVQAIADSPNGEIRLLSIANDPECDILTCYTDTAKMFGITRAEVQTDLEEYGGAIAAYPLLYCDYQIGVAGSTAGVWSASVEVVLDVWVRFADPATTQLED